MITKITIKMAENGFISEVSTEVGTFTKVYEYTYDPYETSDAGGFNKSNPKRVAMAKSLMAFIKDNFKGCLQTRREAGLSIETEKFGYDYDEEGNYISEIRRK